MWACRVSHVSFQSSYETRGQSSGTFGDYRDTSHSTPIARPGVFGTGRGRARPSQASRERTWAASSTERAAASAPIRDGSGDMVLMMMSVKPSAP